MSWGTPSSTCHCAQLCKLTTIPTVIGHIGTALTLALRRRVACMIHANHRSCAFDTLPRGHVPPKNTRCLIMWLAQTVKPHQLRSSSTSLFLMAGFDQGGKRRNEYFQNLALFADPL